mmetsp:Transcript_9460/g.15202  ORF Transcript_9460/g.15202 Transcript_9460/m.15202 type:complete len:247 (+) Transcript_9460:128-868(+)|eukprot:CAMPEP_0178834844 /NCGR_PEP_ID=MMETSP0746-20121128/11305_1 /TAXON_ID=913974 /ORGANISM="Nitzschia punctata, Strain CCMP561" /LENGTH=246 /DNA_ID=CAMNT_0020497369 /DNA_START=219 /DNA_END=959 /DNA_ORIENTATION=-
MSIYERTEHTLSLPLLRKDKNAGTRSAEERIDILDGNGFILTGLLSLSECELFKAQADTFEMEFVNSKKGMGARRVRRVAVQSSDIATWLYDRILRHLGTISNVPNRRIEKGRWEPTGLNNVIRFVRYSPGDFFFPHHDGCVTWSKHEQSILTMMVYLNDDFEGGETRFFQETQRHYESPDLSKLIYSYKPRAGDAMLFYSQQTHDGAELLSGAKYILRTEVMFRMQDDDFPICEPDHEDVDFRPD